MLSYSIPSFNSNVPRNTLQRDMFIVHVTNCVYSSSYCPLSSPGISSSSVWSYSPTIVAGDDSDWTKPSSDKAPTLDWPLPSASSHLTQSTSPGVMGSLERRPLSGDPMLPSPQDDLGCLLDRLGLGMYHQLFLVRVLQYS